MPYETKAHPSVRGFWQNIPAQHHFSKHPLFTQHGADLASKNFEHIQQRLGGENYRHQQSAIMAKLIEIMQIEEQHKDELSQLAKQTVAELFGIDPAYFDAKITDMGQTGEDKPEEFGDAPEDEQDEQDQDEQGEEQEPEQAPKPEMAHGVPMTPGLRHNISKRLTANALIQGSALHAMLTIHNMAAPTLQRISPRLVQLYSEVSAGTAIDPYFQDISRLIAMTQGLKGPAAEQAKLGQSWVEYRPAEDPDQPDQPNQPNQPEQGEGEQVPAPQPERPAIVGRGVLFPVLCQELAKGLMQLWSEHGLQGLPKAHLKAVMHSADRIEDEPYLYHVGPEMWRRFLAVLPKGIGLKYVMTALFRLPPIKFNEFVQTVIANPQQSKQLVDELIANARQIENPEPDQPENNEWQEGDGDEWKNQ